VDVTAHGTLVVMGAGSPPPPGPTSVVAFVPDLMDRSRVEIASTAAGRPVTFVGRPEDLASAVADGARFVVVDLAPAGVLEVLPRLGPAHTVGFASHVDKALLEAARAAGCDEVMARSAVFRRLSRPGGVGQGAETADKRVTSTATSSVCENPPPSTEPRRGETSQ
jgi:hypothetical protein